MKRTILIFCAIGTAIVVNAQRAIVQDYGDQLSKWADTKDFVYQNNITSLYNADGRNGKIKSIISDYISHKLAQKNDVAQNTSYEMELYMGWLDKEVSKGISISVTNVENINSSLIEKKYDRDNVNYVSANVKMSGDVNYDVKDIFYVKDGKIIKIDKYEEKTSKKGKKRVKVDYSDLFDENHGTLGLSYNYGWHFPIGASMNYSFPKVPIMISLDFGMNLDNDEYTIDRVKMQDIVNYTRTTTTLDPKYFLTLTPQFYMSYFAIGCGVGFLYMKGIEETTSYSTSYQEYDSGYSSISHGGGSASIATGSYKFMIRPIVKGFIPCNRSFSLSLSVGYDLVFGFKEKNGINFGLGFECSL